MRTHLLSMDRIPFNVQNDEQALDDALACTFLASDPVSITFHLPVPLLSTPAGTIRYLLPGKLGPRIDRRSDHCTSLIIDSAITTSVMNDLFSVAKPLGERGVAVTSLSAFCNYGNDSVSISASLAAG